MARRKILAGHLMRRSPRREPSAAHSLSDKLPVQNLVTESGESGRALTNTDTAGTSNTECSASTAWPLERSVLFESALTLGLGT